MMIGMLVAGIGCLLAGLAAIGFGIPINEFGLGNTLILAGAVTACSGLLILSLWIAVNELKIVAGQLGSGPALNANGNVSQPVLPRALAAENPPSLVDASGGEQPGGFPPAPSSAPWLDEAAARSSLQEAPPPPASEPAAKPRRNLMFSSSSRKERERAQAREASAAAPVEVSEPPAARFDDAWPKSERVRSADAPPSRRPAARDPSTFSEPASAPPRQAAPVETQVTVLKSGVVDGMAYSLYSDGSIEAQMPEGMMRFASIDELRAHLDQRP